MNTSKKILIPILMCAMLVAATTALLPLQTGGTIHLVLISKLNTIIEDTGTTIPAQIAAIDGAFWDELTSTHTTLGSFGVAVTDILADTAELQGDWADGGRLDLLLDSMNSTRTGVGNIFYVDQNNGDDANSGTDPSAPLRTITAADALCTDNNNDYIIFKGRTTSGGQYQADEAVITHDGVHLVGAAYARGMGGAYSDSTLVWYHTAGAMDSHYPEKVGVQIKADGVEVAGIKFYNPDATQNQFALGFMDYAGDGREFSVHDCYFQGQHTVNTLRTSGIIVIGVESGHIYNNFFYSGEKAIEIRGGGVRYCSKIIVENNVIQGAKYGIHLSGGSTVENAIIDNDFVDKNMYGNTMTNGILIDSNANGNFVARNMFATTTAATAITDSGTNNMFVENYQATAGGTLLNP